MQQRIVAHFFSSPPDGQYPSIMMGHNYLYLTGGYRRLFHYNTQLSNIHSQDYYLILMWMGKCSKVIS